MRFVGLKRYWRDWYVLASVGLVAAWLTAWLLSFGNIYGWMTDDIDQFIRVLRYESGGQNLADIQWFHAWDWFIDFIPWQLHWSVPSHVVPRAWLHTGEFRALILWVIILHAVILLMLAAFLRRLCESRIVCLAALVLFMTTPTFMTYADLLDSRYLGLIFGLPAFLILLEQQKRSGRAGFLPLLYGFALPGFLIGVSQSVHYTILYFAGPFCVVYWLYCVVGKNAGVWPKLMAFVAGILLWIVPVELLSLRFHPWPDSMLGTMLSQTELHSYRWGYASKLVEWGRFFYGEMGVPMMVAVVAGTWFIWRKKDRPPYVNAFQAALLIGTCALGVTYVLFSSSIPLYRQVGFHQIFFGLFAAVAIERVTHAFHAGRVGKATVALAAFIAVAAVPSIVRMPDVFLSAQALGRAVNTAHSLTSEDRVHFIEYYDNDVDPHSIITRSDFFRRRGGDYIITFFPMVFQDKYPDLFALLHDTHPVAAYPSLWCTQETWVEQQVYWNFRRYYSEPESCNVNVYSVSAIRKAQTGVPLHVVRARADSELSRSLSAWQVFMPRLSPPSGRAPTQMWVSKPTVRPHWLEAVFSRPALIGAMTVVTPDYLMPPAFKFVGRPQTTKLFVSHTPDGPLRLVWSRDDLRNYAIYTATFAPQMVGRFRLVITQPPTSGADRDIITEQRLPASRSSGIEYIRFPGYATVTAARAARRQHA